MEVVGEEVSGRKQGQISRLEEWAPGCGEGTVDIRDLLHVKSTIPSLALLIYTARFKATVNIDTLCCFFHIFI